MYHSITFISSDNTEKNTWDDWYLIPSSRPVFSPPGVKTQYVNIPGGNGQIDLTESLTGYPLYENRTGTFEFYVENGHKLWNILYSEIMNFLHGKYLTAYLEDEPDYIYIGRFDVNEWKSDKWWSVITINYDVYPYKKDRIGSLDNWLWDPFNFETGIARDYSNINISGTYTLNIIPTEEPVSPTISLLSGSVTLRFGRKSYNLVTGDNYLPEVIITKGNSTLTFKGNGTVQIDYRGGKL